MRTYRRKLAEYQENEELRLLGRESDAPPGSYQAIRRSYENFSSTRMTEQGLATWAERFGNEVAPTLTKLDDRVVELTSGLDARYAEWRRILNELFEAETGGTAFEGQ